jgi:hypothetical protein
MEDKVLLGKRSMRIRLWVLGVSALCVGLSFFASISFCADLYHGKVIDEETGAPLAGASVTVVWYRTPIVQLEGSLYFQSAQETVTDAQGKFSLEVSPGIDWSPFTTVVKEHSLIIFKPGYAPFEPGRMPKEFWVYRNLVEAFKSGVTIKLLKLKTNEEMRRFSNLSSLGIGRVEEEAIPRLLYNLSQQRKLARLKS